MHAPFPSLPATPRPRPAPVLRRCACGGGGGASGECEACRKKRVQRSASGAAASPDVAPAAVHDVLRSPGQPLDAATRAFMEPRFGHSFSQVRVHSEGDAAESARAVGAKAYAVGSDVVFGAGMYRPGSVDGRRLIAHELAHVVQQSGTAAPTLSASLEVGPVDAPEEREAEAAADRVMADSAVSSGGAGDGGADPMAPPASRGAVRRLMRDPDPAAAAAYPTVDQRAQIQGELNPQAQAAAASGGTVPAVDDPVQFRADITADMHDYIVNRVLPPAQTRAASPVSLSLPQVHDLADVAQTRVQGFFGSYLQAAAPTRSASERSRIASLQLRNETHLVSQFPGGFDEVACHWVASRMGAVQNGRALGNHNVLASSEAAKHRCPLSCPAPAPQAQPGDPRDQALFNQAHGEILCANLADVRTVVQNGPSFERPGDVFIQSQLVQRQGETADRTIRRGRWEALGSLVHEMLHDVTHERFRDAVQGLERSALAVEGFTEFFTREVHEDLRNRAASDAALRASIEGVAAPPDAGVAEQRTGGLYQPGVDAANRIIALVGGNEQNLRAAYFLGRVEMLGLGGWNEAEARRREALRHPANELGFGALLIQDAGGMFSLRYSRVLLGRGGSLQFLLNGDVSYATEGTRLSGAGGLGLRYQWPNIFLQAGVGLGAGASVTQPAEQTFRLDLLPEARAGVRIGSVRVGAGATLLVPLAGGAMSDRTVRLGGLLGLSLDF